MTIYCKKTAFLLHFSLLEALQFYVQCLLINPNFPSWAQTLKNGISYLKHYKISFIGEKCFSLVNRRIFCSFGGLFTCSKPLIAEKSQQQSVSGITAAFSNKAGLVLERFCFLLPEPINNRTAELSRGSGKIQPAVLIKGRHKQLTLRPASCRQACQRPD